MEQMQQVEREPSNSVNAARHVRTICSACLVQSLEHGGCGECQASCQSACKTSCTVANQPCKRQKEQ